MSSSSSSSDSIWRCTNRNCTQSYKKSSGRSIRRHFVACYRMNELTAASTPLTDDQISAMISERQERGEIATGLRRWRMRAARRPAATLPDEERWECPFKCGKEYRSTSSRSIHRHILSCDQNTYGEIDETQMRYLMMSTKARLNSAALLGIDTNGNPIPSSLPVPPPLPPSLRFAQDEHKTTNANDSSLNNNNFIQVLALMKNDQNHQQQQQQQQQQSQPTQQSYQQFQSQPTQQPYQQLSTQQQQLNGALGMNSMNGFQGNNQFNQFSQLNPMNQFNQASNVNSINQNNQSNPLNQMGQFYSQASQASQAQLPQLAQMPIVQTAAQPPIVQSDLERIMWQRPMQAVTSVPPATVNVNNQAVVLANLINYQRFLNQQQQQQGGQQQQAPKPFPEAQAQLAGLSYDPALNSQLNDLRMRHAQLSATQSQLPSNQPQLSTNQLGFQPHQSPYMSFPQTNPSISQSLLPTIATLNNSMNSSMNNSMNNTMTGMNNNGLSGVPGLPGPGFIPSHFIDNASPNQVPGEWASLSTSPGQ